VGTRTANPKRARKNRSEDAALRRNHPKGCRMGYASLYVSCEQDSTASAPDLVCVSVRTSLRPACSYEDEKFRGSSPAALCFDAGDLFIHPCVFWTAPIRRSTDISALFRVVRQAAPASTTKALGALHVSSCACTPPLLTDEHHGWQIQNKTAHAAAGRGGVDHTAGRRPDGRNHSSALPRTGERRVLRTAELFSPCLHAATLESLV
jgi:hypothetical protein